MSLRTMMPTWRSVFQKLFKQVEVVEPTYKDIVMIYRCAPAVFSERCSAPVHRSARLA